MRHRLCPLFIVVALLPAVVQAGYQDVLINDVPAIRQRPDFCGEACVQMWLAHLDTRWTQDDVFNESGLDASLGRGCHTAELNTALKKIGFQTGDVWNKIAFADAAQLEAQWKLLHADLLRGVPSIACMHYSDRADASEHFRLILGYDAKTDEIVYHEPAEEKGEYRRMARAMFLKIWPLPSDEKTSVVIRLSLASEKLAERPKQGTDFTPSDYAQHILALKPKLPAGFSFVIQPPFVVIGDEPAEAVRQRATSTVKWAAEKLKADYFSKNPTDILDVWLFKDKDSYEKHTADIFKDKPTTPYGYYSPAHKSLIMNIATGGGTLVHEIVHPFMAANFPNCPAWFNEGMGSLYEQSSENAGHIVGLTNWRLAGLQKTIRAEKLPTFADLLALSDAEFYRGEVGTHYAQARYLCYYLQQQGLLVKYYHAFVENKKDDATGYQTLQKILKEEDMGAFQKRWEAFAMKLSFP